MIDAIDKQKLEVLDGSRTFGGAAKAAVRREDLSGIVKLTKLTATRVSAAPTAAQYNAMLDDITAIWNALNQVASRVKP